MSSLDPHALEKQVMLTLRRVRDPEIPVNIYDLGLIYDLQVSAEGDVAVRMTLTTPNCPVAQSLPGQVAAAVRETEGVRNVDVQLVFDPPWSPDRMSAAARLHLGLDETGPSRRGDFVPADSFGRRKR